MFGGADKTEPLDYMAKNGGDTPDNTTIIARTADDLHSELNRLIFPHSVVMTDVLSQYVELLPNAEIKVTRADTGTNPPTVTDLYVNGCFTDANTVNGNRILTSVNVDRTGDTSSTGTVTAVFNPEYCIHTHEVFTLSFNVKVTQTAYDEYYDTTPPEYNAVGDPDTDYLLNETGSGKEGFRSDSADSHVIYDVGMNKTLNENYAHPVVQVNAKPTEPPQSYVSFKITRAWEGDNGHLDCRPESITVHLLADNVQYDNAALTAENNWTHTWTNLPKFRLDPVTGEVTDIEVQYTVTEDPVPNYTTEIGFVTSAAAPYSCTITNRLNLVNIQLEKRELSVEGRLLAGATFRLYKTDEEWTKPDTDENGQPIGNPAAPVVRIGEITTAKEAFNIHFEGLAVGNYLLYEIAPLRGYVTEGNENLWCVTVKPDGSFIVRDGANRLEIVDKRELDGGGSCYVILTFLDYELPETGGSGTQIYTLCGIMLMALPLMYLAYDRGRKRKGGIKKAPPLGKFVLPVIKRNDKRFGKPKLFPIPNAKLK